MRASWRPGCTSSPASWPRSAAAEPRQIHRLRLLSLPVPAHELGAALAVTDDVHVDELAFLEIRHPRPDVEVPALVVPRQAVGVGLVRVPEYDVADAHNVGDAAGDRSQIAVGFDRRG